MLVRGVETSTTSAYSRRPGAIFSAIPIIPLAMQFLIATYSAGGTSYHGSPYIRAVSTTITNMRYASTLGGSIYGFSQPPRDNLVWRMGHRGPLDGLYFVGAWTRPGGGFEPAVMSGQMVGAAVVRKAGT